MSTTGEWRIDQPLSIVDAAVHQALKDASVKHRPWFRLSEKDTGNEVAIHYVLEYWRDGTYFVPHQGYLGSITLRQTGNSTSVLRISDSYWRNQTDQEIIEDSYWSREGISAVGARVTPEERAELAQKKTQEMLRLRDNIVIELLSALENDGLIGKSKRRILRENKTRHIDYVDQTRISELRKIKNSNYDLTKLVRLCVEINASFSNECYIATAMLVRAVLDHVPPIFNKRTFSEVANNYNGGKSFRESMLHLENSSRKIGDAHLHIQIRSKEVLPNKAQVNFSNDLDFLLAEIVRILK
jgi:hypothetical protein